MSKLRGRLPSPALLISILALFVALGGAAVAASTVPKNSVDTKAIQKGAVTNSKIKKKTIKSSRLVKGAVRAGKIADGAVGDSKLDSAEKRRWAAVTGTGTLTRGKGVTAATREGTGIYRVVFDRDITECAWTTSIARTDAVVPARGVIKSLLGPSSDTVEVRTELPDGTAQDRHFMIAAFC